MTPGQIILGIVAVVLMAIWAATTPPAEDREYPEYWGP